MFNVINKSDLEVLRYPHGHTDALAIALERARFEVKVSNNFLIRLYLNNTYLINIHLRGHLREDLGEFNIYGDNGLVTNHLERRFKHPLLPTEEERTLFEIEFGLEYPIKPLDN